MYPSGKYKSFTTRDNVFVIEEKKCTEHWRNKMIENYFFVKKKTMLQEIAMMLYVDCTVTVLLLPG